MDSPGYAVAIVEMSICLPLAVKANGFALPWPRPLAQYIIRNTFSVEKLAYMDKTAPILG